MDYDNGISFIRIYVWEYKGAQSGIGNGIMCEGHVVDKLACLNNVIYRHKCY